MKLWAIGDLHLPLGNYKPMDVFGSRWRNYVNKIELSWKNNVGSDDMVVLAGDISWGMNLAQCLPDFRFIDSLPGRKLLLKGNHDYYWSTITSMRRFFEENSIETLDFLHNNSYICSDIVICGTRGWFFEETGSDKIYKRELGRLKVSLESASEFRSDYISVFMHYPPIYRGIEYVEIVNLLKQYDVKSCYFGHLHGESMRYAPEGYQDGIYYKLISADALDFVPHRVEKI